MLESTPYELSPDAIGDEAAGDYSAPVKALTDSRVAALCANAAYRAFLRYETEFHIITRRAADRFLFRDWPGAYGDAAERLGLYGRVLDQLLTEIHELMGTAWRKSCCGSPARQSTHRLSPIAMSGKLRRAFSTL